MESWILKHQIITLLSIMLYIYFALGYFNIILPLIIDTKTIVPHFMLDFNYSIFFFSLLVTFILFLPKIIKNWDSCILISNLGNESKRYFLTGNIFTGLFFSAGTWYFFKSLIIPMDTDSIFSFYFFFDWQQFALVGILALSTIYLYVFCNNEKVRFFNFVGIMFIFVGLITLLYYGTGWYIGTGINVKGSILDTFNNSNHNYFIGLTSANVLFFISIKINNALSKVYNNVCLWTGTLLFSILFSAIGILLDNHVPMKWNYFMLIEFLLYGILLYILISIFLFLSKYKKEINVKQYGLKSWFISISFLATIVTIFFELDILFLIGYFITIIGCFCFLYQLPNNDQLSPIQESSFFKSVITYLLWVILIGAWIWILDWFVTLFIYAASSHSNAINILSIIMEPKMLFIKLLYLQDNYYTFSLTLLFLTFFLIYYFKVKISFEKLLNYMLNGIIISILTFLFIQILQEYILKMQWAYNVLFKKDIILPITYFSNLALIGLLFSLWICRKRMQRMIVWTAVSNMVLYIGIGKLLVHIPYLLAIHFEFFNIKIINLRKPWAWTPFLPYVFAIALLFVSLIIFKLYFKKKGYIILEAMMNCRKPNIEESEKLSKAMEIVHKTIGINVSVIRLLVCQNNSYNAFAMGNNTIALSKSLIKEFDFKSIAGIIGHEWGHVHQKDYYLRLMIFALNFPVHVIKKAIFLLTEEKKVSRLFVVIILLADLIYAGILDTLGDGVTYILVWLFIQTFLFLIQNQDFKNSEFLADQYALECNLGKELKGALSLLLSKENIKKELSLWELLMSDYPNLLERIRRIEFQKNSIGVN